MRTRTGWPAFALAAVLWADARAIAVDAPDGTEADSLLIRMSLQDQTGGDMQWLLLAPAQDQDLAVPDLQLAGRPAIIAVQVADYTTVDGYDAARQLSGVGGIALQDMRSSATFY